MNGITKQRLAIGIFGHHEATTLEATVASLRKISEHLFLLETSGDDATCALAESLGVTVVRHEWEQSDALARNALFDVVEAIETFDWLLWVDGGEVFHADYVHAFRFFCESELHTPQVFLMATVRYHLAHGESLESVMAGSVRRNSDRDEEIAEPRLVPLRQRLRYVGNVRATLVCEDPDTVINVGGAPGLFVRVAPYLESDDRRNERIRRNIDLLCRARDAGEPIVDELLMLHAETMYEMGDFNLARDCYRQMVAQSSKNSLRLEAYYRAADLFELTSQTPDETVAFLVSGLDLFPLDQQLLTLLGLQLQRQKKTELAIRALEAAVEFGKVAFDVIHRRHITEQAMVALSISHQIAGDNAAAIRVVESHLDTVLQRDALSDRLFDLYFLENRSSDAVRLAETTWTGSELRAMRSVVIGACHGAVGAWETALVPLEEAYTSGSRHPITLRWYVLTLLALRRFEAAIPVLDLWVAVEPDNIGPRAFRFAAKEPATFVETMTQIQRSQMNFLGIDSPSAIGLTMPHSELGTLLAGILVAPRSPDAMDDETITKPHHAIALADFVATSAITTETPVALMELDAERDAERDVELDAVTFPCR